MISLLLIQQWLSLDILKIDNFTWLSGDDRIHSGDARHISGGLHLFRHAPWSFPIGQMNNVNFPWGSNLVAMDGNMLLGLLVKVFDPWLPYNFQPFGAWVLICVFLQFFSIYWSLRQLNCPFSWNTWLGAILIGLLPTFYQRIHHLNLMAHFLIIFAWGIYFSEKMNVSRKYHLLISLSFLSLFIHLYFTVPLCCMALLIFWEGYEFQVSRVFMKHLMVSSGVYGVGLLLCMYVIGYFDGFDAKAIGFGFFSMNLNALINPMGWSRYLPNLAFKLGQYEGFQYLGLGLIFFVLISFFFLRNKWLRTINAETFCFLAFLTVYSFSNQWYWDQCLILNLFNPWMWGIGLYVWALFYKTSSDKKQWILFLILGVLCFYSMSLLFRSSGRFFWFVIYPVLLLAFKNFDVYMRCLKIPYANRLWFLGLISLIGIQYRDISPALTKHLYLNTSFQQQQKLETYSLAQVLQKNKIKILFIEPENTERWFDGWAWFDYALFLQNVNLSPVQTEKPKIKYVRTSLKTHIDETLRAGGGVLTKHCNQYNDFLKEELLNGWCLIQLRQG